jgi:hypothetical protein
MCAPARAGTALPLRLRLAVGYSSREAQEELAQDKMAATVDRLP